MERSRRLQNRPRSSFTFWSLGSHYSLLSAEFEERRGRGGGVGIVAHVKRGQFACLVSMALSCGMKSDLQTYQISFPSVLSRNCTDLQSVALRAGLTRDWRLDWSAHDYQNNKGGSQQHQIMSSAEGLSCPLLKHDGGCVQVTAWHKKSLRPEWRPVMGSIWVSSIATSLPTLSNPCAGQTFIAAFQLQAYEDRGSASCTSYPNELRRAKPSWHHQTTSESACLRADRGSGKCTSSSTELGDCVRAGAGSE